MFDASGVVRRCPARPRNAAAGTLAGVVSQPPEILDDRYEVGEVIGRGGMGEVRRGTDRRLGREVAIKFLRGDLAQQPEVRNRFEHEARAAARLMHPAAVTVFDSGESDGIPFLVMERLTGRTLADELRSGPLAENQVRQLAIDVLGALGAAHALGILHRDVKPGNLLFTDGGSVKLADFGIAKSADLADQTMTGQLVGTAAYLAPERLRGNEATPASDLYALGVVLYEALTGVKPFEGDTPMSVAYAVDTTEAPRVRAAVPDVDDRLDEVIHRALAKDPDHRFATAAEMAAALRPLEPTTTAAEPTVVSDSAASTKVLPVAPADDVLERGRQWWTAQGATHRRTYLAAGAAIAVALLLFIAWPGGGGADQPAVPTTTAAPGTTAPTAPPPQPLDNAIRQLENAVKP